MRRQRLNPRCIRLHQAYSVEEAARALGKHKHTIRNWIEAGLPTVDGTRPLLVHGDELRAFLEARRKVVKRPCPPGTIYCFKCRQPREPASGMVEFTPRNPVTGNLVALCETCGTVMHRSARLASLAVIMPGIRVEIREARPRLLERPLPPLNCDERKA